MYYNSFDTMRIVKLICGRREGVSHYEDSGTEG